MKTLNLAILAIAASLLLLPSVASAQVCVLGIMVKAAIVGAQENRELTTKEAATCGLLTDEEASKAAKKKKKVAKAAKKQN
jgi:hypothetical protein